MAELSAVDLSKLARAESKRRRRAERRKAEQEWQAVLAKARTVRFAFEVLDSFETPAPTGPVTLPDLHVGDPRLEEKSAQITTVWRNL